MRYADRLTTERGSFLWPLARVASVDGGLYRQPTLYPLDAVGSVTAYAPPLARGLPRSARNNAAGAYLQRLIVESAYAPRTGDFTATIWFQSRGLNVDSVVAGQASDDSSDGWMLLCVASGNLLVLFRRGGDVSVNAGVNVSDEKPHHLAMVCNRTGNLEAYVDGVLRGSVSMASKAGLDCLPTKRLTVGRRDAAVDPKPCEGSFSMLFLCQRALSAATIRDHYRIGRRALGAARG